MQIGIITYGLDRPLTGIARYTTEVIKAMQQLDAGPEITLLSSGGIDTLLELQLPHVRLAGSQLAPGLMSAGQLHLRRLVQQHNFDLIHDMTGMIPFVLGTGRAKQVVTIYDVIPHSFPGISARWDNLIYHHWLPRMAPRMDAVVTISAHSREQIAKYLKVDLGQIHNVLAGYRAALYQPATAEAIARIREQYNTGERYILFVGSVEKRKNLLRIIEAFTRIQDQIPHKLVITGPQLRLKEAIMESASQLPERIELTGYLPDEELPVVYSGAELFVFPSLYEGFGLPVLEAMACGTPVITSNASSLPEVAGDAGILVDPYSVDEIAAAMLRVVNDADLRETMRRDGLAQAQHFSWEQCARETVAVYEQVLGR